MLTATAEIRPLPVPVLRPPVRCVCGRAVFDGQAVRARVVLVQADATVIAKCQCKRWVPIPLRYPD